MPVSSSDKKNYYAILDLSSGASEEEIRLAYKKLVSAVHLSMLLHVHKASSVFQALKWHPDRHLDNKEDAQEKFIEVCIVSFYCLTPS